MSDPPRPAAPPVRGVDFVVLMTRDFARAERFYVDLLGLTLTARYRRDGGEFETGGVTISMLEAEPLGLEFVAGTTPIAFRVDDVAAVRQRLEAAGVTFRGPTIDSGVCHQAHFTDPDGNALALHHRYAPKAP